MGLKRIVISLIMEKQGKTMKKFKQNDGIWRKAALMPNEGL